MGVSFPMDDREFGQKVASDRGRLATYAHYMTIADCVNRGYAVFEAAYNLGYDLLVDRHGILNRVMTRGTSPSQLQVRIGTTSYRIRELGYDSKTTPMYAIEVFDLMAMVDRRDRLVYYVPAEEIDFTKDKFSIRKEDRERFLKFT